VLPRAHQPPRRRPPAGLDKPRRYRERETGVTRSGAGWMHGGVLLPVLDGDYQGKMVVLEAVD